MSKIDPEALEIQATGSMVVKTDANGAVIGWKGPWLPDWYDNYTECLKDNQTELRRKQLARDGRNEQGQTKEQEKEFKHRQAVQLQRKQKAEAALLASQDLEGGK